MGSGMTITAETFAPITDAAADYAPIILGVLLTIAALSWGIRWIMRLVRGAK